MSKAPSDRIGVEKKKSKELSDFDKAIKLSLLEAAQQSAGVLDDSEDEFEPNKFFKPPPKKASTLLSKDSDESKLSQLRLQLSKAISRRVEAAAQESNLSKEIKKLNKAINTKKRDRIIHPHESIEVLPAAAFGTHRTSCASERMEPQATGNLWNASHQDDSELLFHLENIHKTSMDAIRNHEIDEERLYSTEAHDALAHHCNRLEPLLERAPEESLEAGLVCIHDLILHLRAADTTRDNAEAASNIILAFIHKQLSLPSAPRDPVPTPVAEAETVQPPPELNLDLSIPESPTAPAAPIIIDLTDSKSDPGRSPLSPAEISSLEDQASTFRMLSQPQQHSSSTADTVLTDDGSLPEGCIVYDPNPHVSVFELSGMKRRRYGPEPLPSIDETREEPEPVYATSSLSCTMMEEGAASQPHPVVAAFDIKMLEQRAGHHAEPDLSLLSDAEIKALAKKYGLKIQKKSTMLSLFSSIWRSNNAQLSTGMITVLRKEPVDKAPVMTLLVTQDILSRYLQDEREWYEKVITFEPVDLDVLHAELLTRNYRVTKPALRELLDELNVFVSYGAAPASNGGGGGRTAKRKKMNKL